MLFRVSARLEYEAEFPSTLILNIHAQRNAAQDVLDEQLSIEPRVKVAEFTLEGTGNRFLRLETGEHKTLAISYSASVDCDFQTYRGRHGRTHAGCRAERIDDSLSVSQPLLPVRQAEPAGLGLVRQDREPARESRGDQRLDPRQRRVSARQHQLDDLGVRHRHAADRGVPRLLAPRRSRYAAR